MKQRRSVKVQARQRQRVHMAVVGATRGDLRIESRPTGARIQLDGKPVGAAPVLVERLSAGAHRLVAVFDGVTVDKEVEVEAGQLTEVLVSQASDHEIVLWGSFGEWAYKDCWWTGSYNDCSFYGRENVGGGVGWVWREWRWAWLEGRIGALDREDSYIGLTQWAQWSIKQGAPDRWLPGDRVALKLGVGLHAVDLRPGISAAARIDCYWFWFETMLGWGDYEADGWSMFGGLRLSPF